MLIMLQESLPNYTIIVVAATCLSHSPQKELKEVYVSPHLLLSLQLCEVGWAKRECGRAKVTQ